MAAIPGQLKRVGLRYIRRGHVFNDVPTGLDRILYGIQRNELIYDKSQILNINRFPSMRQGWRYIAQWLKA